MVLKSVTWHLVDNALSRQSSWSTVHLVDSAVGRQCTWLTNLSFVIAYGKNYRVHRVRLYITDFITTQDQLLFYVESSDVNRNRFRIRWNR